MMLILPTITLDSPTVSEAWPLMALCCPFSVVSV